MGVIYTGRGASISLAPLPDGVITEPTPCTPTVATGGADKGDTSIPVTALPSGVFIPAGTFLGFVNASGYEVLAQLSADAVATDTSLDVYALPENIAAAATAEYPLTLKGRTSADLDRSGNRVTSVTFDDDGYETGLTTTISIGLNLAGNWSPLDAGYATAEYWFNEGIQQLYFYLALPNVRPTAYSKGRVYKGPGSITSMPLSIPADGIISGEIQAAFNGKPTIVAPVPTV